MQGSLLNIIFKTQKNEDQKNQSLKQVPVLIVTLAA